MPGKLKLYSLIAAFSFMLTSAFSCFPVERVVSTTTPPPTTVVTYAPSPISLMPSLNGIVNKVMPSIVYIYVETNTEIAAGTGMLLRPDGYILTNRHVIEGARKVEVTLHDRRVYPVSSKNIWLDDIADLAVIKIDESNLPTLQFGNPDIIQVGDWVIAIGHAMGLSPLEGGATVTVGIVSNLGRSYVLGNSTNYDLIQTDAAINPGNSGGPLVNLDGEVIGINSAGVSDAQGIGYAINVGTARHIFEDLVQYGKPHHPYLGVNVVDITQDRARLLDCGCITGAIISRIEASSPVSSAGLRTNDIISSIAGHEIASVSDFIRQLWRQDAGDTVEVTFWRNGTTMKVNITLAERPQTKAF